ncbi:MAG: NUDIX domain-containing protein [Candidatus Taylorbacteria bacterium]
MKKVTSVYCKKDYKGTSEVEYIVEYSDTDSFDDLDYDLCRQVYGICFCEDKLVIGYGGQKKNWGLIGGTIEKGETFEQTLRREIKEESNMEVLEFMPVGYQKVTDTRDGSYFFQLRYTCTTRPYGTFVLDPAGGITKIKLIDPKDYKKYFDWGRIGERMIERALELRNITSFPY